MVAECPVAGVVVASHVGEVDEVVAVVYEVCAECGGVDVLYFFWLVNEDYVH